MNEGVCNKCHSGKLVIVGILVLVWNFYLTGSFIGRNWATFVGILLVVKGFLMMSMPNCSHYSVNQPEKKQAEKKKK